MAFTKTNKIKKRTPLWMTNFLRYETLLLGPKKLDCCKAPEIALYLCWARHIFLSMHWMCNILSKKGDQLLDTIRCIHKAKKQTRSWFLLLEYSLQGHLLERRLAHLSGLRRYSRREKAFKEGRGILGGKFSNFSKNFKKCKQMMWKFIEFL